MIYPILRLDNPSTPFIIINDTEIFNQPHEPIYLDPQCNPYETLYNLIGDFLLQYDDGFDDGLVEGLNAGDDEDE